MGAGRFLCNNGAMFQYESVWPIVVVFALLAVAVALFVAFALADGIRQWACSHVPGALHPGDWLASVRRGVSRRGPRSQEESDDVSDSTAALLSMLHDSSLVIDDSDGVVRANPEAYRLGVVSDDALVNGEILAAVHEIRVTGGRKQFDLTTSTPQRFSGFRTGSGMESDERGGGDGGDGDGGDGEECALEVSRPNWLKVTVGRIDEHFVVVLLNDVSEAIRFSQTREAFISNVSQQLLKPTQDLERLADSLESARLDREQVRQDARAVRRSCHHLSHMIDDLLLLIRAQEPITPSCANRLSVAEQLRWAADGLHDLSGRLGVPIVVHADDSLMVNAERDQIRAALVKLIENALLYSARGSSVSVSATLSADGRHVVIRVIDRGCGIDRNEQPHIFERFYRADNQNDKTGDGIGLGLAIVKHVALTHHGSASVWSAPKQGSTFSLTLPVAR